jgi:hypothetical protein
MENSTESVDMQNSAESVDDLFEAEMCRGIK